MCRTGGSRERWGAARRPGERAGLEGPRAGGAKQRCLCTLDAEVRFVTGSTPRQPILVQKFGGTSVAGPERIRNVVNRILAARREGYGVVVVVSAPGGMTDDLLAQARELNPEPSRRELDVLLSTGEQISIALVALALEAAGQPALSLTGLQAGIHTDGVHGQARILRV